MKLKNIIFPLLMALMTLHCAASSQSRSFGEIVEDKVVAFRLKTKYMKDRDVPAKDVSVNVWRGAVTLKGELVEQEQINRAIEIAERQKGVKEVKAFLVLKEFGESRKIKSERPSFFKKMFSSSGSKSGRKQDTLKEKDLTDGVSDGIEHDEEAEMVASESMTTRKRLQEEPETDNLDEEEEF